MIPFQTLEEIHNCNNPNTLGNKTQPNHLVCNWDEEDFEVVVVNRKTYRVLKTQDKDDNYFEKRARKKYWKKRKEFLGEIHANRR